MASWNMHHESRSVDLFPEEKEDFPPSNFPKNQAQLCFPHVLNGCSDRPSIKQKDARHRSNGKKADIYNLVSRAGESEHL